MCVPSEKVDVAFVKDCFSEEVDFISMMYVLEILCDTLKHAFHFKIK